MSDAATSTPDTIVGISFDDAFRAQEFLTATNRLASKQTLELLDAVMIVKDPTGKTTVRETRDLQPGMSALSGGMWAGLFGLILGGPVGWIAGTAIGAGAGAVTAKVVDHGIPDDWVKWFRDAVRPETVTVVLLIGALDAPASLEELRRFAGAHLVYANLDPNAVERIRDALGEPSPPPLETEPAEPAEPARPGRPGESDEPPVD